MRSLGETSMSGHEVKPSVYVCVNSGYEFVACNLCMRSLRKSPGVTSGHEVSIRGHCIS